jgi:hypothetical protein
VELADELPGNLPHWQKVKMLQKCGTHVAAELEALSTYNGRWEQRRHSVRWQCALLVVHQQHFKVRGALHEKLVEACAICMLAQTRAADGEQQTHA